MRGRLWIITGAARGLGLALARSVLDSGDNVIGTSRDGKLPPALSGYPNLVMVSLDLSGGDVSILRDIALERFGRIDVLVNNAGYAQIGPIEGMDAVTVRDQMDVNFFAPLALAQAVLPVMRRQGSGHIVNISSVGGICPSPGSTLYSASKAALNALSIGLAMEVEPFGIKVMLIEPRSFRTDFLSAGSLRQAGEGLAAYEGSVGCFYDRLRGLSGSQSGDPVKAAAVIRKLVDDPEAPRRLILGSDGIRYARAVLEAQLADMRSWQSIGESTDFHTG